MDKYYHWNFIFSKICVCVCARRGASWWWWGDRCIKLPYYILKCLTNFEKIAHSQYINVCCHKIPNQNLKHNSETKMINSTLNSTYFGLMIWPIITSMMSNLWFLCLGQCFDFWYEILWQHTLMLCQCFRIFFFRFFKCFKCVMQSGRPVALQGWVTGYIPREGGF